jgi:tetratricopeptide (TPR) repeat protein
MRGFTQALGVRCSSCHVGEEGQPLSTYDFASDEKDMKVTAREMLKMVMAINGTYLANLPDRHDPELRVTCVTCHRGVRRPVLIESIVGATVEGQGIDAAVAKYRELRDQYYGSYSYDFTDRPLLAAAQAVGEADANAARRLLELNLEFNPNSALTLFALAQSHADAGDKDQAIELLRRSLAIMPDNPRGQRLLRELTGGA